MDKILLKVPVTIKAKLTEKLKNFLINNLTRDLNQVNLELKQIDRDEAKVIAEQGQNDEERIFQIRHHFDIERQKRFDFQAKASKQLEDTRKLAIGAEIVQGTLEHLVEVSVGTNMREIMNVEVLVEDDKVIAIRS